MKKNWMSNVLTVALPMMLLCVVLALGASAAAEGPGTGPCSNRSLFGDYGMQVEGTFLGSSWPLRTIVMVHFDGRGNSTSQSYVVVPGDFAKCLLPSNCMATFQPSGNVFHPAIARQMGRPSDNLS